MKKTYIQPDLRVAHLNPVQMLCTSDPMFGVNQGLYEEVDVE